MVRTQYATPPLAPSCRHQHSCASVKPVTVGRRQAHNARCQVSDCELLSLMVFDGISRAQSVAALHQLNCGIWRVLWQLIFDHIWFVHLLFRHDRAHTRQLPCYALHGSDGNDSRPCDTLSCTTKKMRKGCLHIEVTKCFWRAFCSVLMIFNTETVTHPEHFPIVPAHSPRPQDLTELHPMTSQNAYPYRGDQAGVFGDLPPAYEERAL